MSVDVRGTSVVVCAYSERRWHNLLGAVASLRQQTRPPGEIIVCVDHNENLLARVHSDVPDVRAVKNGEAPGLSGNRNSGVKVARGSLIAFLDDDAVAAPNWLERLNALCSDPRVAGAGGAVVPLWQVGRPRWFPSEFDWVVGCTYRGVPERISAIRNLVGANMCFRRDVFETVGGFRDGIGRIGAVPVGCEETELCIRTQQALPDRIFLYDPAARVYHHVPPSRTSWRYFRARCYAEGVSKARVARLVGAERGLARERSHAVRTLPRGIARGLLDVALARDTSGLSRAAVILAGLAFTIAGYVAGSLSESTVPRTAKQNEGNPWKNGPFGVGRTQDERASGREAIR